MEQIDDNTSDKDDEQGSGEVVVLFCEGPEGYTEQEEDVERFDDLVDYQLDDPWLPDHHRPWAVRLPQAQSHLS